MTNRGLRACIWGRGAGAVCFIRLFFRSRTFAPLKLPRNYNRVSCDSRRLHRTEQLRRAFGSKKVVEEPIRVPAKQRSKTYLAPQTCALFLLALCIFFLCVLYPRLLALVETRQVFFAGCEIKRNLLRLVGIRLALFRGGRHGEIFWLCDARGMPWPYTGGPVSW
ncbi:hypothetical protein BS50DRAFT_203565 [Corynespora cassiicola Philippines]|uniref:Uncharacterized protein n=1 Tax=Corynespora cassiicola Philippines TaxID=1448308 RepID=A0A2T2N547_CORCC|nr:hypothetical protein BS50DRAFT_203565 [Corynespora cassiicola Philippines]